ncbi:MAG: transglutaminase-like domain-containing protein [Vicinamibacteria bacterium]|nr:transglutaminase-like domain-containing protein [Vicinamibacteria bacterium]
MRRVLERIAWAAFAAAAVVVCARGLRAPWLIAFALPAVASAFFAGPEPSPRVARALTALLAVVVAPTLLLGWVLMAYPVLPPSFVRVVSLGCGGMLCALCAVLAPLAESRWRQGRLGAAALGAIAVGAFDPTGPIAIPLRAAATAAVLLLAVGRVNPRRALRLAFALVVAVTVAEATMRALPPAQDRVEAALADLAAGAASGASSGHARLGEMESLQLSREIVLRAWMPSARRLRMRVYSRFDGQTWHPGAGGLVPLVADETAVGGLARDFASMPGRTWSVPEPPPGARVAIRVVAAGLGPGTLATPRGVVLLRAPIDGGTVDDAGVVLPPARDRIEAYAVAVVAQPPAREPDAATLAATLAVPADTDPRLRALAAELAAGLPDARARGHRVAAYVSTRARYTTDPGKFRSRQPVAEFLFEKRAGYCEYFASASALLLRLMGVPARYVTGYVVQEWSRSGDHYVVRAADTHAWIEAWAGPEHGWIELDPTPAAEYDALRRDSAAGVIERVIERLRGESARAWAVLRAGDLGALSALFRERPLLALPVLLALVPLLRRAWARRPRWAVAAVPASLSPAAPPELHALRLRHDAAVARLGAPRPPARGLVEHAETLSAGLPGEVRGAALRAAEALSAARFGGAPLPPAAAATEALEQSVRDLGR